MTDPRPHAVVAALALAGLLVAGCAIQDEAQPRTIDPGAVPFSLLATSTTSTTEATAARTVEVPVSIFLVDSDTELVAEVVRLISPPPSVRAGLRELLMGPSEEELARGLNSTIARSTTLLGVDGPQDGVVTVNLSDDLRNIGGQGQRLALAQVVFTATADPEITGVLFAFEGEVSEVPNGQGVSTTEPLARDDFATFDPTAPQPPGPPPPEPPPPPPEAPAGPSG